MKKALLVTSALVFLAGCAHQEPPVTQTPAPQPGGIVVNSGYQAGSMLALPDTPTPTLEEIVDVEPAEEAYSDPEDKMRIPAMKETALSYGARAGLAYTAKQINGTLQQRSAELDRIYDFRRLMIPGPNGSMMLPPVISEARDTWESQDLGKTLRVADQVYEIIKQTRFAPVAPLWHSYLIREYSAPSKPPGAVLPKNDGERDLWRRWVKDGWEMGSRQAHEIFEADMRRLERDFTGMVRYKQLLSEGKVSQPVVAATDLGVTGTGQDMRVADKVMRITRDPELQLNPGEWRAAPSPRTPREASRRIRERLTTEPAPNPVPRPLETAPLPVEPDGGIGDTKSNVRLRRF